MVDVVTETGDEESQDFDVAQYGEAIAVFEESVAEMSYREGVRPVMVGGIAVALFYHEDKPKANDKMNFKDCVR